MRLLRGHLVIVMLPLNVCGGTVMSCRSPQWTESRLRKIWRLMKRWRCGSGRSCEHFKREGWKLRTVTRHEWKPRTVAWIQVKGLEMIWESSAGI